jgi:hypothetical protein
MRITRKSYEKARTVVAEARQQIQVVKAWEDAVRQLGGLGNQRLVAITLNGDGSIKTECELFNVSSATAVLEEKPELPEQKSS